MERLESLLEVIALELAHARLRQPPSETASGGNDRELNLERVITAKAHALGLAAATMLTAKLEYRYRSAVGKDFTPSLEHALRIEAALWADNYFSDKYARASLLASKARVMVGTNLDGNYQGCVMELEQPGLAWVEV